MSRRTRFFIMSGLVVGLLAIVLVWRTARRDEPASLSPLASPLSIPSPLLPPTPSATSRAVASEAAQSVPPTGTPTVNTATLEAIRAHRPTATPPTPSGIGLPYISPATWRRWALWIFAAAGVLAYVGLRLRQS